MPSRQGETVELSTSTIFFLSPPVTPNQTQNIVHNYEKKKKENNRDEYHHHPSAADADANTSLSHTIVNGTNLFRLRFLMHFLPSPLNTRHTHTRFSDTIYIAHSDLMDVFLHVYSPCPQVTSF